LLACLLGAHAAARSETGVAVNPMRKVVTMLQMMSKKVEAQGEVEQELFDKFMCYCEGGAGALQTSIDAATTKIPQVEASLGKMGAEKAQLASDVVQHKSDREAAKTAMAEATSLREKEAAAFAAESTEDSTNIAAMGKAITAIEKGAGGAFLQTSAASVLKNFALNADLADADRDTITAFLSNDDGESSTSGEIVGILKQMKETMETGLSEAQKGEATASANYDGLMAAKTKEVEAATAAIEDKIGRMGEAAVELVDMAEDLDDTKKALAEDTKFLADMDTMCATKKSEFATAQKLRAEELLALADTIKMLNDDDALELFKKTLPGSASLLQITVTNREVLQDAKQALKKVSRDPRLEFIALALRGKKVDMSKVIKMIDEMVTLLGEEQVSDNEKKAYCEKEFDTAEDTKKQLERAIGKLEKAIDENTSAIATLKEEIEALDDGIKKLDKQVVEATEQRKEENEDFQATTAANTAAVELIGMAKNRMQKFYNPKLYKAPPKRELTEDERITLNMGGTLAPTAAPGGIAGTGVAVFLQTSQKDAPAPPPESPGAAKKQESGGVIAMMDSMVADVNKELQEMEFEEKDAQKEYEQFMADSTDKRADDSKTMADKSGVLAETEGTLQKNNEGLAAKNNEAMANGQYISSLHGECDWLISNYDARKEARNGEIDGLKKAKAVLSGADYALVQRTSRTHLRQISRA